MRGTWRKGLQPNNSLKLTRRASGKGGAPGLPACAKIMRGLPASAGQLSSRPLGGATMNAVAVAQHSG
jgi:hypothetical protein